MTTSDEFRFHCDLLFHQKSNSKLLSQLYDSNPPHEPTRILFDDTHYDIFRKDVEAIQRLTNEYRGDWIGNRLIDLGCGDLAAFHYKIEPIIKRFRIEDYVGIDKNDHYLNRIVEYAANSRGKCNVTVDVNDIFQPSRKILAGSQDAVIVFGHTIGSIPWSDQETSESDLAEWLSQDHFTACNSILISLDLLRDKDRVLRTYSGPLTNSFLRTAWEKVCHARPEYEFLKSSAEPHVFWDDRKRAIVFSFRFTKDQKLTVTGQPVRLDKSTLLVCGYSRRFSIEEVQSAIIHGTGKGVRCYPSEDGSLVLLHARMP